MQALKPEASILVILMGSLGDVTRGLYLAQSIKAQSPKCRITWLVEPASAELVRLHPAVDRVVVFERRFSFSSLRRTLRELRAARYDLVLDLQRHFKSGCFSLLSGARQRLGFHRRDAKEFNWVFNSAHIPYVGDRLSKLQHYLKFVQFVGLAEKDLGSGLERLDLKSHLERLRIEAAEPYIFMVLGSAWESKNWLISGYSALLDDLCGKQGFQVYLLGAATQRHLGAELEQRAGHRLVRNLAGETSLIELLAVIKYARAGAGPDSGPGHLAAAVQVPYVALFGPTAPGRTAPWGQAQLVLRSNIGCAPCNLRRCPGLNRLCMRLISADSVKAKITEALTTGVGAHPQGQL